VRSVETLTTAKLATPHLAASTLRCGAGYPSTFPTIGMKCHSKALMAHFERARRGHGAPQTTVEALMFAMRSGAKALSEPSNQRRLKELSEAQLHEVCARLQKFKSNIARAWTQAEIEGLVTIWAELKNG